MVSAAIGGAIGTAATLALAEPPPTTPTKESAKSEESRVSAPAAAETTDSEQRVRLRSLEQKVSLLTAALAKGGVGADREGEDTSDVASPVFEAAVRDLLDRIDEERREERQSRRGARMEEGARALSENLTRKLGLSKDQEQKLVEATKRHFAALMALGDESSETRPKTSAERRERREALRQQMDDELSRIFSGAQHAAYEELPDEERIGARRPWSGDRPQRGERSGAPGRGAQP